jgi:hypothetical protein
MTTALEFIKSKITYPIDIYENQSFIKGNNDNFETQLERLQNAKQIVIGDLHGNLNKALETFILANLVEIKLENLKIFYELFDDPNNWIDKTNIDEMIDCLKDIKWIDKNRSMIFIGDILADRVGNDIISLSFFEILRKSGLNIKTIIGNHDHVCNFEDRANANAMKKYADSFFNACNVFDNESLENQNKTKTQLDNFIANSKIIIYNKDTKNLFVHAGIRKLNFASAIKLLKNLDILKLDFELNQDTIVEFCCKLNQFYVDYRINNKYKEKKYIIENKFLKSIDAGGNRRLEGWFWVGEHWFEVDYEYFQKIGINTIIHGHDSDSKKSIFSPSNKSYNSNNFTVINLDNVQGKDILYKNEGSPIQIRM